ncbi:MAG: hypothetical protein DMD81_04085 [Candidatus Rokuibacteriota bacterium]|nr:MAG: hypothetical protein DMD81_04085 [Candidatus Rokubacteria bacterium]
MDETTSRPWIEFTKWPYEEEMFHFQVAASDCGFSASQEFYGYADDVTTFGTALQAFPRGRGDEVVLEAGRRDMGFAHWVSVRVYLYDSVGHAAVALNVSNNGHEPYRREARFTIRCEVASLNQLGDALVHWIRSSARTVHVALTPVGA